MDELLDYLTEPLRHDMYAEATQIRQCRAVFVWISHHIDYDQELYSNPAKLRQSDQDETGIARYPGYARSPRSLLITWFIALRVMQLLAMYTAACRCMCM